VKSLNYLFTVSELRFLRYHVCTIKVLINKRVCNPVTYSTSIGNSFQPCLQMYTTTCGQRELLSEKYLRSLEAPLVQNSTWRGKSNASIFKLCDWFSENNLQANPDKSQFILFTNFNGHVTTIWLLLYVHRISLRHDDVKSQNKPAALCILGFIGGPLSDYTVIIPPF